MRKNFRIASECKLRHAREIPQFRFYVAKTRRQSGLRSSLLKKSSRLLTIVTYRHRRSCRRECLTIGHCIMLDEYSSNESDLKL